MGKIPATNLPEKGLICKIWEFSESPVVRTQRFGAFTAMAHVQSLVGELRSSKLCSADKKKGGVDMQNI